MPLSLWASQVADGYTRRGVSAVLSDIALVMLAGAWTRLQLEGISDSRCAPQRIAKHLRFRGTAGLLMLVAGLVVVGANKLGAVKGVQSVAVCVAAVAGGLTLYAFVQVLRAEHALPPSTSPSTDTSDNESSR